MCLSRQQHQALAPIGKGEGGGGGGGASKQVKNQYKRMYKNQLALWRTRRIVDWKSFSLTIDSCQVYRQINTYFVETDNSN